MTACPQHPHPDPLCHVEQAAPALRAYDVQRSPDDEGMPWQAIRDVLLMALAVAAILFTLKPDEWRAIAVSLGALVLVDGVLHVFRRDHAPALGG